jgi:hypothetical protein
MSKFLFLFLFCLLPFLVMGQLKTDTLGKAVVEDTIGKKDLIDIVRSLIKITPRKVSKDEKKKIYFSILPVSSTGAGGSKVLVTSTTAGFYLGDQQTTYISSVTFAPYLNFQGRYGLPIHSSLWLKNNSYNIQGDTRVLVYPQNTWGLGGGQSYQDRLSVNYTYIRFYQSALKRITPYFFAGIGYNLDYYIGIEPQSTDINALQKFTGYQYGTQPNQNSFSSGPSINLLYDTRNNDINPVPGTYANLIYRNNGVAFGSDNNWQSLYIDFRKYISLTKANEKNMFAFWTYFWTTLTPGTPYLDLPAIGMDPSQRSGRGIDQNRYRGQRLFYFETEYRRDITRDGLLGFVVFANINSASQPVTNRFTYWNPAGGTGLRIKFNKKSDTNIGIDYGFSKDYSSLLLNLGEAF